MERAELFRHFEEENSAVSQSLTVAGRLSSHHKLAHQLPPQVCWRQYCQHVRLQLRSFQHKRKAKGQLTFYAGLRRLQWGQKTSWAQKLWHDKAFACEATTQCEPV